MPKYRYLGAGPCRHGAQEVRAGDVVDASASPGKNFVLVEERSEEVRPRRRTAPEAPDKE